MDSKKLRECIIAFATMLKEHKKADPNIWECFMPSLDIPQDEYSARNFLGVWFGIIEERVLDAETILLNKFHYEARGEGYSPGRGFLNREKPIQEQITDEFLLKLYSHFVNLVVCNKMHVFIEEAEKQGRSMTETATELKEKLKVESSRILAAARHFVRCIQCGSEIANLEVCAWVSLHRRKPRTQQVLCDEYHNELAGLYVELPGAVSIAISQIQHGEGFDKVVNRAYSLIDKFYRDGITNRDGIKVPHSEFDVLPESILAKYAHPQNDPLALVSIEDERKSIREQIESSGLSSNEIEIMTLCLSDPELMERGGNIELANLLGRSPDQIRQEKSRAIKKIRKQA